MKGKTDSSVPLIKSDERERFTAGLGILDASGVEAGGRVAEITEEEGRITIVFSYYVTKSPNGLNLRMEEPLEFDTSVPAFKVHRVMVECIAIEEGPDSIVILLPDPKKIADDIRRGKKT